MNTLPLSLLLLLAFVHFSCFLVLVPVSAKVFLSIDCGSSSLKSLTDDNSIEWVGDDPYVQTGEAHTVNVAPNVAGTWDSRVMSTLRAFPTRKRNCYSIDISSKDKDTTTAERVLVRASFYYGNYDDKSNPPTFDLQFNGNHWTEIQTSMGDITHKEVVYSLNNGNNINVCLAQLYSGDIPFISALEIRSLDSGAYSNFGSDYPVHFIARDAFGATKAIRYPEDSFDRIWDSAVSRGALITVRGNSPSIKANVQDKPPEAVLRTAITPSISPGYIRYSGGGSSVSQSHFNVYFSEVIKLDSTQRRPFDITVNDTLGNSIISHENPVIPPYGSALEVNIFNVSHFFNSSFSIEFKQTTDSTLPPLLNAIEWYIIGEKLVRETNSNDGIFLS
ncbi:hypothetical protein MKW94_028945 [Papaver nudicaule]|uniref:Malectin-like domain-containing protein n=1 Tax=Papaver nudicaule TaxID=74823 RepID=A0AA41SMT7_PAPNU|nr:hypothetical protein [Papaver nudicaule]